LTATIWPDESASGEARNLMTVGDLVDVAEATQGTRGAIAALASPPPEFSRRGGTDRGDRVDAGCLRPRPSGVTFTACLLATTGQRLRPPRSPEG